MNEKYYDIASEMVDQCMERWSTKCKKISSVIGNKLKEIELLHPFINRKSVLLHGDHVTTETGTGCVHTAPAHGMDDHIICNCLLYTSPSPRDYAASRMPSSA